MNVKIAFYNVTILLVRNIIIVPPIVYGGGWIQNRRRGK